MTRAHKNKGGKRIHGLLTQEPSPHRTLSVLLITKGKTNYQVFICCCFSASPPPPPPPSPPPGPIPPPPPPPACLRRGYENTRRVHSPSRDVGLQECLVCEFWRYGPDDGKLLAYCRERMGSINERMKRRNKWERKPSLSYCKQLFSSTGHWVPATGTRNVPTAASFY